MNFEIPQTIKSYFELTASEAHAEVAELFAPEAVIVDEGEDREIVGRDAIHQWKIELASQLKTTVEVIDFVEKEGTQTATALVSGNFPGSPAEFKYHFEISPEGLIHRLVIEFVSLR